MQKQFSFPAGQYVPGANYTFYAYVATMDEWKSAASKPYPFTAPAKWVPASFRLTGPARAYVLVRRIEAALCTP